MQRAVYLSYCQPPCNERPVYCQGACNVTPGIVGAGSGSTAAFALVVAMLAGMYAQHRPAR